MGRILQWAEPLCCFPKPQIEKHLNGLHVVQEGNSVSSRLVEWKQLPTEFWVTHTLTSFTCCHLHLVQNTLQGNKMDSLGLEMRIKRSQFTQSQFGLCLLFTVTFLLCKYFLFLCS